MSLLILPARTAGIKSRTTTGPLRRAHLIGAVLINSSGSIIATGTNDVPKFEGGLYWEDDAHDERDHKRGFDLSDQKRLHMMAEVFANLKQEGWLSPAKSAKSADELAEEALRSEGAILKGTRMDSIIEFMRAVHAEQAAITEAARRGSSSHDCDLVVTTFPCHQCSGLIVAAGIKRVCYIAPYPKSLATELYDDSITLGADAGRVQYQPFQGVAPRAYARLFSDEGLKRKRPDGTAWIRSGTDCQLRLTYNGSRPDTEQGEVLTTWVLEKLLEPNGGPATPT